MGLETIDVPDVETLIIPDTLIADGEQCARVEGYGLAHTAKLRLSLIIAVRVVVNPEKIDGAVSGPEGDELAEAW